MNCPFILVNTWRYFGWVMFTPVHYIMNEQNMLVNTSSFAVGNAIMKYTNPAITFTWNEIPNITYTRSKVILMGAISNPRGTTNTPIAKLYTNICWLLSSRKDLILCSGSQYCFVKAWLLWKISWRIVSRLYKRI